MEILVLGNGFDLYHHLPTKYENVLHTIGFLQRHKDEHFKTIGDVLGDETLCESDRYLSSCYEKHKKVYDSYELDTDIINDIICLANENIWFSYFLIAYNKDLGWIDFETKIAEVIETFRKFFENDSIVFTLHGNNLDAKDSFILKQFDFFYRTTNVSSRSGKFYVEYQKKICNSYLTADPFGSDNYIIDKDKIINFMYEHLKKLIKMIRLYLECFVETVTNTKESFEQIPFLLDTSIDMLFTFNYTNTFQKIYNTATEQRHIHGNIHNDNIILGISSDKYDEIEDMNTDFICFKKYYQRLIYDTEINENDDIFHCLIFKEKSETIRLTIIGHSLDASDKDTLFPLFEVANEINIYYHNEAAKADDVFAKSNFP